MSQMNKDQLLSIVERIEKLNAESAAIAADTKEVYREARSQGFDTKCIRKCIELRKKGENEVYEEDELLRMYREALGI